MELKWRDLEVHDGQINWETRTVRYQRHTESLPDQAGKKAAWRALEVCLPIMEEGRPVSFLFLPEGEDPDSCIRREGLAKFQTPMGSPSVICLTGMESVMAK